jgi:hypothetical protein
MSSTRALPGEKITKNHHITGNGFKRPPLFGKFSKNNQSTGNT